MISFIIPNMGNHHSSRPKHNKYDNRPTYVSPSPTVTQPTVQPVTYPQQQQPYIQPTAYPQQQQQQQQQQPYVQSTAYPQQQPYVQPTAYPQQQQQPHVQPTAYPQQSYQGLAPPPIQQATQHYQGLAPPPIQQDPFTKYQISAYYRNDLATLNHFDIILVLDDSGSMGTATDCGTRWSELKYMAAAIIDIGSSLDDDGIDVMFLNRGTRRNVRSVNDVIDLFDKPPGGNTPLSNKVREAMRLPRKNPEKPILLLISTDGVPDTGCRFNDPNYDSIKVFRHVLEVERDPAKVFVGILKCSDKDDETGYLDAMDKELLNLDVIDDYKSEKREVLAKQRPGFVYTEGDNIARFMLGAIFPKYDNMDEKFVE